MHVRKNNMLNQRLLSKPEDSRRQASCDHRLVDLLRQRVYALTLGHEDLNDHGELSSRTGACRRRPVGWRRWRVLQTVQAGKSVYRATLAELIDALIQAEREGRLTEKIRFYARTGGVGPARARTNLFSIRPNN